ncbi:hypothetical protein GCM10010430_51100 [Kitasatospora cystarginea]|uniref:Uncharacterized protein n=1 Tax=Kitasatospora cystarginea TaxID=58350 RepID=A0ABN3EKH6_9ACTN
MGVDEEREVRADDGEPVPQREREGVLVAEQRGAGMSASSGKAPAIRAPSSVRNPAPVPEHLHQQVERGHRTHTVPRGGSFWSAAAARRRSGAPAPTGRALMVGDGS